MQTVKAPERRHWRKVPVICQTITKFWTFKKDIHFYLPVHIVSANAPFLIHGITKNADFLVSPSFSDVLTRIGVVRKSMEWIGSSSFRRVESQSQRHMLRSSTVVSRKKQQNVFCNIFYRTRAILMKFGTLFPELICCKIM